MNDPFSNFYNTKNRYSKRQTGNNLKPISNDILKYHRRDSSTYSSNDMFNDIFSGFTQNKQNLNINKRNSTLPENIKSLQNNQEIKNIQLENLDNITSSMEAISSEVQNAEQKNEGVKLVNQFAKELELPKLNKWKIISKAELESSTRAKMISKKTVNKDKNNSISKSKIMEMNSKNDESKSSMNFNMLLEDNKLKEQKLELSVPEDYQINLKDKHGQLMKTLQYRKKIKKPKFMYWRIGQKDIYRFIDEKGDLEKGLTPLPKYVVVTDPKKQKEMKYNLNN